MTETARPPAPPASQTLTFLFADLRDYTRFVEQFGDAAATTLIGDYRRIVRGEVAKASGAEVKTEGDSFYVVFPSARSAVTCAIGILRDADRYSKDRADRPMKVGVGIHAGEPTPHEGQYVGAAVIVAARLAQQAGPGELLVSEVVRALLPKELAPPMSEREGLTLKGIDHPPRVFAIAWQASAPAAATPRGVAIEAAPPSRMILCPEIVGRQAELSALEAQLRDVLAGRGRTVLVGGEAGLGKTALLKRFAERAAAQGTRFLIGECSEIEARRPFGPVIEALTAGGLPLPAELGQGGPGAQPLAELERYRVHAAFAKTLSEAAADGPVVLAIEDLHWADEATLELVPYLARKIRDHSILLLGTYRTDELHRLHPLNHLLAELARGRLAEEVRLHKLTADETGAVIQGALGLNRTPTTAFREAIQDRCEGNPFFIEEVLRALVERGDLAYRDGAWHRTKEVADLAIPVSIRDAVQQRLRALPADARRAMHVAAVIGQRFTFELLQRVSGLNEGELLEALRGAIDEQLIQEESDAQEEGYRFRHALTRETVLGELLQRERRLLHRAVGETLEAKAGAAAIQFAEELAYHFDEARDQERAFQYHRLAAREADRLFAFGRALRHLERAAELARDDEPGLDDLHLRLADAAYQAGDLDRASRAAEEARAIFSAAGDVRGTGAALERLARYRWYFGESAQALALAQQAAALLEPLGASVELAGAYAELARLAMLMGRNTDAVTTGERAAEMARTVHAPAVEVEALITVGTAMSYMGQADGEALLRRAIRSAEERDFVSSALRAHQNLVAMHIRLGHPFEQALRDHDAGVAYARRYGLRHDPQVGRESFVMVTLGEWDAALRLIDETTTDTIWSIARQVMGVVLMTARSGSDPDRLRELRELRRRLLAAGDPQWVVSGAESSLVHFVSGDLRAAIDDASPLLDLAPGGQANAYALAVAFAAADAAHRLDDQVALERWLTRLQHPAPETDLAARAGRDFARGLMAERARDVGTALDLYGRSAETLRDVTAAFVPATIVRLHLVELLLERGDRVRAQAELDTALPYWRRAKATWYLGRLAEWARERGLKVEA